MISFFTKYKIIFYLSNFILILLYLFPGSLIGYFLHGDFKLQPQITPDYIISSNHLYSFLLLSIVYNALNSSSYKSTWGSFSPKHLSVNSKSVFNLEIK